MKIKVPPCLLERILPMILIKTCFFIVAKNSGSMVAQGFSATFRASMCIASSSSIIETNAERSLLKALQGGCQVPIGAYAQLKSNGLFLDGLVGSIDGAITFRKEIRGTKKEPDKLGQLLAKDLVKAGAGAVLNEIYQTNRVK